MRCPPRDMVSTVRCCGVQAGGCDGSPHARRRTMSRTHAPYTALTLAAFCNTHPTLRRLMQSDPEWTEYWTRTRDDLIFWQLLGLDAQRDIYGAELADTLNQALSQLEGWTLGDHRGLRIPVPVAAMSVLEWAVLTPDQKHALVPAAAAVAATDAYAQRMLEVWKEHATCTLGQLLQPEGHSAFYLPLCTKLRERVGDMTVMEWNRLGYPDQLAAVGGDTHCHMYMGVVLGGTIF